MKITIFWGAVALSVFAPFMATADTGEFDFVQISDPQLGKVSMEHDTAALTTAVQLVNNLDPPADFVIFSGDLIDTVKNATALNQFLSIVSALSIPYYCGVGNNDLGGGALADNLETFRTVVGPDRMSFDHAGFLFVLLNTELWQSSLAAEISAQETWLDGVWRGRLENPLLSSAIIHSTSTRLPNPIRLMPFPRHTARRCWPTWRQITRSRISPATRIRPS